MSYLAYHFKVEPPQPGSEILIAVIAEWGFDSFDTTDDGFTAYIKADLAEVVHLEELVFDDFTFRFSVDKIEAENWNAEWEKNFEPVLVDDLLCIRAPFHEPNTAVKHQIVIMPKMSFGTGHHQTTRLMCREMFGIHLRGARVLDMGTGTGILAILAKMLGAAEVVGIDIDEWSVENAIENCAVNGFANIRILKGDVDLLQSEKAFECILANINKNILKVQLPFYSTSLLAGGYLLLSGFFTTDVAELRAVAEDLGFVFVHSRSENEWAMVLLRKN